MEITALPPHRRVRFQPLQVQPQANHSATLDWLNPELLVTLCSWCNGVEVTNGLSHWLPIDQAAQVLGLLVRRPQAITHGLCPACSTALAQPENSKGFDHLKRGLAPSTTRPAPEN